MNEVPNIISTKDLAYIKDMLNWLYLTIKKCNHYIDIVSDKEINLFIKKVSNEHKKHYETLLKSIE